MNEADTRAELIDALRRPGNSIESQRGEQVERGVGLIIIKLHLDIFIF